MKPNPNICPYCDAPLTDLGQCISLFCETNRYCDLCPGIRLTVRGRCPNTACPNSFIGDSVEPPPRERDESVFTRVTMHFDVPIVDCRICGKAYESVFPSCPHCEERVNELRKKMLFRAADEEAHRRFTMPPPIGPSSYADLVSNTKGTPRKPSSPAVDIRIQEVDELEGWMAKELLKEEPFK